MEFQIIRTIYNIKTFAARSGIREIDRLRRIYGEGKWRKRKGVAEIIFADGNSYLAELHWYKANGIGRKEVKIKRLIE